MATEAELAQDVKDIKKSVSDTALKTAEEVIGWFANVTQIIGIPSTIASLIALINQIGGNDPTQNALQDIQNKLTALINFDHAESEILKMRMIVDTLAPAWVRLNTQLHSPEAVNPTDTLQDITLALSTLADPGYWTRPYYVEAVYVIPGIPAGIVDPPHDSQVFDYRLTLPAFTEAIRIFLCSLTLLLNQFPAYEQVFQENQALLKSTADTLNKKYETIVEGFVMFPAPRIDNIVYTNPDLGPGQSLPPIFENPPTWSPSDSACSWDIGEKRMFGVVDSYWGTGLVDAWPSNEFPAADSAHVPKIEYVPVILPFGPNHVKVAAQYDILVVRHRFGTKARWLQLYVETGLTRIWSMIQTLRKLGGENPESFDTFIWWSLREANDWLGTLFEDPSPVPPLVRVTGKDTIRRLGFVGGLPQQPGSPNPLSWRGALAAVVQNLLAAVPG
jgi:hypothetical protein